MATIHPTAIVEAGAQLHDTVSVDAYAIVRKHVRIGAGTTVGPHTLIEGHTTIGRDNGNDIVLESITVSRQHALLMCDAAGVQLLDLESTNGTLVNGVQLPPDAPVRLADGDVVRIGQVIARYSIAQGSKTSKNKETSYET